MTKNKYWSTATDDVRNAFMVMRKDKSAASKAFYVWLADQKAQERQAERQRLLEILAEEEQIGEAILKKEDCNADCYKCDIAGHVTIRTVKSIRAKLEGTPSNETLQEKE